MCLDQTPKFLQQIQVGFANNDHHMIRAAAHNLKGDCHNFGAQKLAELAAKLQNVNNSNFKELESLLPQLQQSWDKVSTKLKEITASEMELLQTKETVESQTQERSGSRGPSK